jgi:iron complex outermembrane recepter protein
MGCWRSRLLWLLPLTLVPSTAFAQSGSSEGSSKFAAADDVAAEDDIVITARKRAEAERLQDVPISATVLNEAQYEAVFPVDVRDLAALSPNVKIQGSALAGLSNLIIRGTGVVGSLPSDAPAVGIFHNGVFLGTQYASLQDTFDIESIEILRGPQGTLQGRNVTGGAVLYRTKRPGDDFGFDLEGLLGNHGRGDLSLAVEGPVAEGAIAARLVALYRHHDGWFHNLVTDEPIGGHTTNLLRGTIVARPAPTLSLTFIGERYRQDGDGQVVVGNTVPGSFPYNAGYRRPKDKWDVVLDSPGTYDIKVDSATLEANWEVGPGVVTSITGFRDTFNYSDIDTDGTPFRGLNQSVLFNANQFSEELRYAAQLGSWLDFTLGAYYFDYEHQFREGRTIINDTTIFASGNSVHQRAKALFGEADVSLPYNLTATVGGRYTRESITARSRAFGGCPLPATTDPNRYRVLTLPCDLGPKGTVKFSDFSPKFGLSWKPSPEHLLYGTVSRGFRSGGFSLRGNNLPPPYNEERVTAFELGYKGSWLDDRFRVSLALFRNNFDDLQRTIIFVTQQRTGNAAKARIQGAELELVFEPVERLVLSGALGYTDADFESFVGLDVTGDLIPDPELAEQLEFHHVPKIDGNMNATYTLPVSRDLLADIRVAANYQSKVFLDVANTLSQSGFVLFDASLALRSESNGWKVALFGKNIANKYYTYAAVQGGIFGLPEWSGAPRTFGIQLSYSY